MDERRKAAYRYLLAEAVQHIRGASSWASSVSVQAVIEEEAERVTFADAAQWAFHCWHVSYAVHNLAYASVRDFRNFNEEHFWFRMRQLFDNEEMLPYYQRYKDNFEKFLTTTL